MLKIVIEEVDMFDERKDEFIQSPRIEVELEHSLISLSKWESKYQKPFLTNDSKTNEEVFAYIQAMVLTPGLDPDALLLCSQKNIDEIQTYIDSSQSATTFGALPERRGPGEIITSELIYYWMIAFQIPFECQHWHLNRLFSLVQICNIKNSKPRQMSRNEIAHRNRELNAQRRAEFGTSG